MKDFQLEERQAIVGAIADPDKAWERVVAAAGGDLTLPLLLAIAAELRATRRRAELRRERRAARRAARKG